MRRDQMLGDDGRVYGFDAAGVSECPDCHEFHKPNGCVCCPNHKGFGPYDADPKGHDFDPVTRECRICHLSVGTHGVTGLVPCLSPRAPGRGA